MAVASVEFQVFTWSNRTLDGFGGHGVVGRSQGWPVHLDAQGGKLPELCTLPYLSDLAYSVGSDRRDPDAFFFQYEGASVFGQRWYAGLDGAGRPGNYFAVCFLDASGQMGALDALEFLESVNSAELVDPAEAPSDLLPSIAWTLRGSWAEWVSADDSGERLAVWEDLLEMGIASVDVSSVREVRMVFAAGARVMSAMLVSTVPFFTVLRPDGARLLTIGLGGGGVVDPAQTGSSEWDSLELRHEVVGVLSAAKGVVLGSDPEWSLRGSRGARENLGALLEFAQSRRDPFGLTAEQIVLGWQSFVRSDRGNRAVAALCEKLGQRIPASRRALLESIAAGSDLGSALVRYVLKQGSDSSLVSPEVRIDVVASLGSDVQFRQTLRSLGPLNRVDVSEEFVERALALGSPSDLTVRSIIQDNPAFWGSIVEASDEWFLWCLGQYLKGSWAPQLFVQGAGKRVNASAGRVVGEALSGGVSASEVWNRLKHLVGPERAQGVFMEGGAAPVRFISESLARTNSGRARRAFVRRRLPLILAAYGLPPRLSRYIVFRSVWMKWPIIFGVLLAAGGLGLLVGYLVWRV